MAVCPACFLGHSDKQCRACLAVCPACFVHSDEHWEKAWMMVVTTEAEGRVIEIDSNGVIEYQIVLSLRPMNGVVVQLLRESERLVVVATGGGNDNNKKEREVTKGVCVYPYYQLDRRRIRRQLPCDDIG
jgi:hypothetical protein